MLQGSICYLRASYPLCIKRPMIVVELHKAQYGVSMLIVFADYIDSIDSEARLYPEVLAGPGCQLLLLSSANGVLMSMT